MAGHHSDKPFGADNQQERPVSAEWICGFVDGEGCFSVSLIKNKTTKSGVQIFPEFVVTQGAKSLNALEEIQHFFGCGNIFVNRRFDDHREPIYRYCVRSINDLTSIIVPFFANHSLRTAKENDFVIFQKIIRRMRTKDHLTEKGRRSIVQMIGTMNRKKLRWQESSETLRRTLTLSKGR